MRETGQRGAAASQARRELREAAEEYCAATRAMARAERLVRGTLRQFAKKSPDGSVREYPRLHRTVNGVAQGRSVKLADAAWLGPLLNEHRAYRAAQQQLEQLHARVTTSAERLRYSVLWDYEPTRTDEGSLVVVTDKRRNRA